MLWRKKKIKLQSGDLRFVLPSGEAFDCDLTIVKLICESLERRHNLQRVGNQIEASESFLESLAGELVTLGCAGCTPTLARQIWIAASEKFSQVESEFLAQLRKL